MNKMQREREFPLLTMVMLCFLVSSAHARFLPSFSGHHRAIGTDDITFELTSNFAVLDRANGQSGDPFGSGLSTFDNLPFGPGIGSGPLDLSANFLYLYQAIVRSLRQRRYASSQSGSTMAILRCIRSRPTRPV